MRAINFNFSFIRDEFPLIIFNLKVKEEKTIGTSINLSQLSSAYIQIVIITNLLFVCFIHFIYF
jgi:hypothetical protein